MSEQHKRAVNVVRCLLNEATGGMPDLRSVSKWEAKEAADYLLALLTREAERQVSEEARG